MCSRTNFKVEVYFHNTYMYVKLNYNIKDFSLLPYTYLYINILG